MNLDEKMILLATAFLFLPYLMPSPMEIYPAAAPRSLPAAQGKGPSA